MGWCPGILRQTSEGRGSSRAVHYGEASFRSWLTTRSSFLVLAIEVGERHRAVPGGGVMFLGEEQAGGRFGQDKGREERGALVEPDFLPAGIRR